TNANFTDTYLHRAKFIDCQLDYTSFQNAYTLTTVFENVNFTGAVIPKTFRVEFSILSNGTRVEDYQTEDFYYLDYSNLVTNGDAESEICSNGTNILNTKPPSGWSGTAKVVECVAVSVNSEGCCFWLRGSDYGEPFAMYQDLNITIYLQLIDFNRAEYRLAADMDAKPEISIYFLANIMDKSLRVDTVSHEYEDSFTSIEYVERTNRIPTSTRAITVLVYSYDRGILDNIRFIIEHSNES
ncbi:unnamed protein product, partial [Didymodactylos carnosus]